MTGKPGRQILSVAAIVLAVAGVAAMFAPDEIGRSLAPGSSAGGSLALQLAGSGLLGFACMDWMSRGVRIGGIYGRPLAIGNLVLCTTAALALAKAAPSTPVVILAILFGALALAFAWLAFAHDPLD